MFFLGDDSGSDEQDEITYGRLAEEERRATDAVLDRIGKRDFGARRWAQVKAEDAAKMRERR